MSYFCQFLLLLLFTVSSAHKCIHNNISSRVKIIAPPQQQIKPLHKSSSEYTPLKITTTYKSNLVEQSKQMDQLIDRMIKITKILWANVLSVQSTKIMFPLGEFQCAEAVVSAEDRKIKDSDLHLFVTLQSVPNDTFIAWASACAIAGNGRPIFGRINFNKHYISQTNKSNYNFQKDLETTIHEMIHVLGFSPPLFDYWVSKPLIMSQYKFTTIVTPKIVSWMGSHFKCKMGAPLENQGGDGSLGAHWERSVFQNQIMTASDMSERLVFSNLTMALLDSTGWYRVNSIFAQSFIWGRNEGCKFISSLCKGSFPEFCYGSNTLSCTYDSSAIATCISDSFSDSCSYYAAYKNTICQDQSLFGLVNTGSVFKHDSKCFKSNIIQENSTRIINMDYRCFRYKCIGGAILVIIGESVQILCQKPNQVISLNSVPSTKNNTVYKGYITCPPNFFEFCESSNYSEKYCYQNGYSISGRCICGEGFFGDNCNSTCTPGWFSYGQTCVKECPIGTNLLISQNTCVSGCPPETYQSRGKCIDCPLYCLQCANGVCQVCFKSAVLVNGSCIPSLPISAYERVLKLCIFVTMIFLF